MTLIVPEDLNSTSFTRLSGPPHPFSMACSFAALGFPHNTVEG
jgi:hypothetical protein